MNTPIMKLYPVPWTFASIMITCVSARFAGSDGRHGYRAPVRSETQSALTKVGVLGEQKVAPEAASRCSSESTRPS
jgi:hypothetical protein